jgi:hypothetical protein
LLLDRDQPRTDQNPSSRIPLSEIRLLKPTLATYLVLPQVNDENLRAGEGEECTLSLEVLVLASLSTVGSLYVHDKEWVGRSGPAHPYALGGLLTACFIHDVKGSAKEAVKEGT